MTEQRIIAWSYSRFQTYEQCPLKAKFQFIDKLKTASSPALEKGLAFHKECERFLKGEVDRVPPLLNTFAKELRKLRKDRAKSEVEWTLNSQWQPTTWFAKDAWCRLKVDAMFTKKNILTMIDFKTGKVREDHQDQLSLYALVAFLLMPEITEVKAELWYFDTAHVTSMTYMREELEQLQAKWQDKTSAMLSDTDFAANPGFMCRFCSFSQSSTEEGNRGKCKF